ncbi:MmgE/PrpD family protein [Bosea psychrotolerans]|uniref:2-methylcitrate dehydratase PrpD n=1 Tax=Bosea psychrotolerans TaxID=1871628 RepID=A0A2S4LXR7_9HYPH|nr:MmgE/PrpD family protein [Bosea psychrotolerans]POR47178.1 2-methylcitrate dehydratase PrpD [Bosea psychrotolerans]
MRPENTRPAAETLAAFYAGVRVEDLPPETIHAVRRHVLDTLGASLAGVRQPEPEAAFATARIAYGDSGPALLWGRAQTAAPAAAALVNGTAAHALELDDASGCDHSGAVVVPAVLAALPLAAGADEGDLIAAVAIGYDLGRRVLEASGGYNAHNNAGWHSTGTCGVFGAAAAVARLLACDEATTRNAFGIAGSFASGTWAFMSDGAMTKRLHPGHAAASGVLAVLLARSGMTGPAAIFDAPWGGFLPTYARDEADWAALTSGLGTDWRIHRSSIKPYASCRGTHAAVEAMLRLRGEGASVRNISAIRVNVHPTIVRMCAATSVTTLLDAQMSLPYAVAVALVRGAADLPMFSEAVRRDPAVLDQARRVEVVESVEPMTNVAAELVLDFTDGAQRRMRIDVPAGSATNPLPDDGVIAKYRSLAAPILGAGQAAALEDAVLRLGRGVQPAELLGALHLPGR